jgi:hypothetical protein
VPDAVVHDGPLDSMSSFLIGRRPSGLKGSVAPT